MKFMKLSRNFFLVFLMAGFLSGCASSFPMALNTQDKALPNVENKKIVLMSLRTSNQYHESYQPDAQYISVVNQKTQEKQMFELGKPFEQGKDYRYYLVSMALDPAQYQIQDVMGRSYSVVPPIVASFDATHDSDFKVGNKNPLYIGRLSLTLVKRTNDQQPRGGSVFPLLDQAVSGYSGGTFKISIRNDYEKDMQRFMQAYPSLNGVKVNTKLMREYQR